jgi:hypothetical protein
VQADLWSTEADASLLLLDLEKAFRSSLCGDSAVPVSGKRGKFPDYAQSNQHFEGIFDGFLREPHPIELCAGLPSVWHEKPALITPD